MARLNPRQQKKVLILVLTVCAIVIAGLCLKPWYDRYMENDHLATCRQARLVIVDRYNRAVDALLDAGTPEDEVDWDTVLLQVIHENFPEAEVVKYTEAVQSGSESAAGQGASASSGTESAQADPAGNNREDTGIYYDIHRLSIQADPAHTYLVSGICRSGGVYTVAIDPVSRKVDTWCSYRLGEEIIHGEYSFGFHPFR